MLKLIRTVSMYLLRSKCFSRLAFSKTIWGLLLFLVVGIIFTVKGLWNEHVLDYFKWLGPFFFGSRALDNLTNININRNEGEEKNDK